MAPKAPKKKLHIFEITAKSLDDVETVLKGLDVHAMILEHVRVRKSEEQPELEWGIHVYLEPKEVDKFVASLKESGKIKKIKLIVTVGDSVGEET